MPHPKFLPAVAACLAGIAGLATPSAALPPDGAGLAAVEIVISNSGADPLTCHAEIAHWFATDLAQIAPGQDAALDLWRDPASGTYATRNTGGEFLPVERVWCGIAGRAYPSRWQIELTQPDTPAPPPRRFDCAAQDIRVICR